MKILTLLDKDERGIVRLKIKRFLRRPEWVFGFEEQGYHTGDWSSWTGLLWRSSADGRVHPDASSIDAAYRWKLGEKRDEAAAESALNKFLELD